jgi:hypothetical protein
VESSLGQARSAATETAFSLTAPRQDSS